MKRKKVIGHLSWFRRSKEDGQKSIIFQPSIYHALIIIFLEFFSWGLLTSPVITVLNDTFPQQTFLMNGLIQGVKGMLSFFSAPLIGALSDVWGRKPFLLLTVTATCAPIPLMTISPWWYFVVLTLSGVFSVTFSIVFAYVADVTDNEERSAAYGLVSATFAASLVTSPAIGAYLGSAYGDHVVVALATVIAVADSLFIFCLLPESLPLKVRPAVLCGGSHMSWEKADPFGALRRIGEEPLILLLCVATFLAYLPEAGEYSSFFVYLRLVMNFSAEMIAFFIAFVGVLSVLSQTIFLALLMRYLGSKHSIMVGLGFEMMQLTIYGFGSEMWLMWVAGGLAAMGSLTYPAISAFVSNHASPNQQGVAQGVLTGIRGLCNGLGPAMFGLLFYLFHVDLSGPLTTAAPPLNRTLTATSPTNMLYHMHQTVMPGPPFAFGAVLVILALLVSVYIPESSHSPISRTAPKRGSIPVPTDDHSSGGSLCQYVFRFDDTGNVRCENESPMSDDPEFSSQE